ncbi:rhomboid family intramembrane serine protease [Planctomycetota bacterium]
MGLSLLRKVIGREYANKLWINAMHGIGQKGARCPSCGKKMLAVPLKVPTSEENIQIDLCRPCQFVWFDTKEFEQVPAKAGPKADGKAELSSEAKKELALWKVERIAKEAEEEDSFGGEPPADPWKWLPAVFGMPVEQDVNPLSCWPWITWGLSASFVLIFLLTMKSLAAAVEDFGFVPANMWRHGGATFVTSFFLHGGVWHLIGNTYFLLIFGDNVEDFVGRGRYIMLIVSAALVGTLAHAMCDPGSTVPCIGASGGISGVIVFYALKFPRAKLGFLIRHYYIWRWAYMPAFVALILWMIIQFGLAYAQVRGFSNVSAFAHLGGALIGFITWYHWREG